MSNRQSVLLFILCLVSLAWVFLTFKPKPILTTEVTCISPIQTFRVQAAPGTSLTWDVEDDRVRIESNNGEVFYFIFTAPLICAFTTGPKVPMEPLRMPIKPHVPPKELSA